MRANRRPTRHRHRHGESSVYRIDRTTRIASFRGDITLAGVTIEETVSNCRMDSSLVRCGRSIDDRDSATPSQTSNSILVQ